MDDANFNFFSSTLMVLITVAAITGHSAEIEYISPARQSELEREFTQAEFSNQPLGAIKHKLWRCDMYGVRSRMQVRRGVKLYYWTNKHNWTNSGAQVVRNYRHEGHQLAGSNEHIEDQIRMNKKGILVARLSSLKPERRVIAYSVCAGP